MDDIILVGYGGHAKSVADSIKRQNIYKIVGYTDIKDNCVEYDYLGTDDILQKLFDSGIKNAVLCIGYLGKSTVREQLYHKMKGIGFDFPIIIDPSAVVSEDSIINEGTFVGKNSIVNAGAKIGKGCIVNTGAIVEHDCVVNDFSHIAVGTVLCGQVTIGRACLIGANATIIQSLSITDNTIIPAGTVVRCDK